MALIDSDGLFNGDRLRRCSDRARLLWPYFYLASNGFARLEINYHRIISRCFATFKKPPSESEIGACLQEYESHSLLFTYSVAGQVWGQWDSKLENLPRYKTATDRRSPAPPEPAFSEWKKAYQSEKGAFPKLRVNVSERFQLGIGVGVGVGVGEKHKCASAGANARAPELFSIDNPPFATTPQAPTPMKTPVVKQARALTAQQEVWFALWWAEFWRRKNKKQARNAWANWVKTESDFERVMKATRAQAREMLARLPENRPHGATWLNDERWSDENDPPVQALPQETIDYPEIPA